MSRDDGFQTADLATAFFDDTKVRLLWRALGESALMSEAITAYLAVVLASWGAGRRVTVDEAAPLWLSLTPEVRAALVKVGLLDRGGRVSVKAWNGWHSPAVARREARRCAGRSGGIAKAQQSSSNATASLYPSIPSVPSTPSVPTGPSIPRAETTVAEQGRKNGRGGPMQPVGIVAPRVVRDLRR